MPMIPSAYIGKKVSENPIAVSQNWTLPTLSERNRPVILGNQ